MIEYALLTALIALAVIAGIRAVADPINNSYSTIASKFHKHIGKHLGQSK
jgi:Flp pilus assembly pilin Flp